MLRSRSMIVFIGLVLSCCNRNIHVGNVEMCGLHLSEIGRHLFGWDKYKRVRDTVCYMPITNIS